MNEKTTMTTTSFANTYGLITVADAIYLNKVAKALETGK